MLRAILSQPTGTGRRPSRWPKTKRFKQSKSQPVSTFCSDGHFELPGSAVTSNTLRQRNENARGHESNRFTSLLPVSPTSSSAVFAELNHLMASEGWHRYGGYQEIKNQRLSYPPCPNLLPTLSSLSRIGSRTPITASLCVVAIKSKVLVDHRFAPMIVTSEQITMLFTGRKFMAITLSYIGEEVIANMANQNPRRFIKALGLSDKMVDWNHVQSTTPFAYPHCKIESRRPIIFDGQHQVDVALWVRPKCAVALELKLGITRLSGNTFNERFVKTCGIGHGGTRVTGSMIAILERRLGPFLGKSDLYVNLENETSVKLAPKWGLIVQQSVLDSWAKGVAPDLSENALVTSIQKLVNNYGRKREFNQLTQELLVFDYFDQWRLATGKSVAGSTERSEATHTRL